MFIITYNLSNNYLLNVYIYIYIHIYIYIYIYILLLLLLLNSLLTNKTLYVYRRHI